MNNKLFKVIFPLLLIVITVFSLTACGSVELKLDFIVDGDVYATVNTNGNEVIKLPADPQKEGYKFDSWYWDEGVWKKPFTANSLLDTPLSENLKVYAKWITEDTLTGTDISIEGFERVNDSTFSLIVNDDVEKFSLADIVTVSSSSTWILTSDIGGVNVIPSKTVALQQGNNTFFILVTDKDNKTALYEIRIKRLQQYTVTYILDGGTNSSQNKLEYNTDDLPLKLYDATKDGYKFEGWFTKGFEKQVTQIDKGEDITLYASFVVEGMNFIPATDNGSYILSKYDGDLSDIRIDSVYRGKPVTGIGQNAFTDCRALSSIIIPESIVSIGSEAFAHCDNLQAAYYLSGKSEWADIFVDSGNAILTNAIHYYSEEQPVGSGKYWHYVDGKPVAWIVVSSYTHNTFTSVSPENWNSLTYSDDNEKQIIDYINSPFFEYDYVFDSNGDIVKGAYDVKYSAATALTDVTAKYADAFGYSKEAKGYAWQITLRNDIRWDDGTLVKASDFVYSMQEQLNPLFRNSRASDFFGGDISIRNAAQYAKQGLVKDETISVLYSSVSQAKAAGYSELYLDFNAIDATLNEWFGLGYEQADDSGVFQKHFTIYDYDGYKTDQTFFDKYNVLAAPNNQIKLTDTMLADFSRCFDFVYDADSDISHFSVIKNYEYKAVNWSEVGMFTGDTEYDIVLCLDKPLELLDIDGTLSYKAVQYLASLPLVKQSLYESCKKAPTDNYSPWESYYNSSVETSASWGPYKLTSYEYGKNYVLERNPYWYGYTANLYEGQYQTDKIVCETIGEWQSAWLKFQQGELDGISMDTSISFDYKNSKQAYFTPSDHVASFQLQSDEEALKSREKAGINKTILTYTEFRKALSLGIDRTAFANACTTSSLAGFGLFNDMHYYDVDNGKLYRESDAAKQALCNVYGVDPADFGGDLDKAVASITGYDLAQAKALVNAAYDKAIADGKMNTGDRVQLVWGASADNENTRRAFEFVKYSWTELMKGTRLEGKFELIFDAHFGDNWANDFRNGKYDVCAGGWIGSAWDPGNLLFAYLSPDYMYSSAWDTFAQQMTFTMPVPQPDGSVKDTELTMSLMSWFDCLNGIQGCEYDWSANAVSQEVRLPLIAALEEQILLAYYTLPMYNEHKASLMSFKTDYISYEYNTFMEYGGIRYMTYNYTDSEWSEYVQSQGGMLNYR